MPSWDEFCGQRRGALERFVNGDAGPCKQLWSHADDVTIFGGSCIATLTASGRVRTRHRSRERIGWRLSPGSGSATTVVL